MAATGARNKAKRPVRRARQARSRATVETIVEATTRILAGAGWDAVNTNAIAKRAGVSVGSVYEYFANKQAVLDLIVDRHLTRAEDLIRGSASLVGASPQPEKVVQALVAGFIVLHREDPPLHRALASTVPLSIRQRERIDALRGRTVALVTAALAGRVDRPEIKATLLVDAADAIAHRWIIDEVGVPVAPDLMQAELETMLSLYVGSARPD